MPLPNLSDPKVLKFLTENYEKEKLLRLHWLSKNKERIEDATILKRPPTNYTDTDIRKHIMSAGMAFLSQDHIEAGNYRRRKFLSDNPPKGIEDLKHGHSILDIGLGDPNVDPKLQRSDSDLTLDPVMRPVDEKLKELIYKDKPEFGRVPYLEKRCKILPENRYYFPESVNWEYGWRFKDGGRRERAIYGRCWHLTRTLNNRVGPQTDPLYYKPAHELTANKCTSI